MTKPKKVKTPVPKKAPKKIIDIPEPVAFFDNGLTPVYVMTDEIDDVEAMCYRIIDSGEPIFYFLANDSKSSTYKKGTQTVKETENAPALFRVSQALVGVSINRMDADSQELPLASCSPKAKYSMPKIPRSMLNAINAFFRQVEKEFQTEAIVILTYNQSQEGSTKSQGLGWGWRVPKQSNTSAHCNYEPPTVHEELEDGEIIVGSMHSHPGMDAFCSGTDQGDQTNFDGLHVTFGWGSNSKLDRSQTEFHAELQLGGKAWSLKAANVFAPAESESAFDFSDVIKEKVSKRAYGSTSRSVGSNYAGGAWDMDDYYSSWGDNIPGVKSLGSKASKAKDSPPRYTEPGIAKKDVITEGLPDILTDVDFQSVRNTLLVAPLLEHAKITSCLACGSDTSDDERKHYRCTSCLSYFVGVDKRVQDLLDARKRLPTSGLDMRENQVQSVWSLEETMEDDDGEEVVVLYADLIHEATLSKKGSSS